MNISELSLINQKTINSAGPRYTPVIEPNFPNLAISSLISTFETISLSIRYKNNLKKFIDNLQKDFNNVTADEAYLFKTDSSKHLLKLLEKLAQQQPGKSSIIVNEIIKKINAIYTTLQNEVNKLYDLEHNSTEDKEETKKIQNQRSKVRKWSSVISNVKDFFSAEGALIVNNKMLLLGEWGTGKTHFLCDIVTQSMKTKLPCLFFLAYTLQSKANPLQAICEGTKLAGTPEQLLQRLNKIGKKSGTRTILIIDGINEADRPVWKKYINTIINLLDRYPYVGLILSCRTPFHRQIFNANNYKKFVIIEHKGFEDIEFNAQREFFNYYKIPHPQIPLLTPEFSRPLFLKILCKTYSGQTSSTRSSWIKEIASGQRSMTKLFEDFVSQIGDSIEMQYSLPNKTCWRILKGHTTKEGKLIGLAANMARQQKDYISTDECLQIIKDVTKKSKAESSKILYSMITEGLLVEDILWMERPRKDIIRLPYQRFSDHLIARHLLSNYLNTKSKGAIKQSFYKNKPLGKIFDLQPRAWEYPEPGLATAIMLEFPERVKNKLPKDENELVYYLPEKNKLIAPLVDTFLEGVLWRNKNSFSKQTATIFGILLNWKNPEIVKKTYDVLVHLATRLGHPYSASRLCRHLVKQKITQRDLNWGEFIRTSYSDSVIHRLLNWIEDSSKEPIERDAANNLCILLSLFLVTVDRNLRDRVTKCLVLLGERHPNALFIATIESFAMNDPYVPERMLAASYGVLMRLWAFPPSNLIEPALKFAQAVYTKLFSKKASYHTTHILIRDYANEIIILVNQFKKGFLGKVDIMSIKATLPAVIKIPPANKINESYTKRADWALHIHFENYSIGRLVSNRSNYDSNHVEYKNVLRQIKWRILNLGYRKSLFDDIDRRIAEQAFYREQRENGGKIDRYGKKYSWIAYYEVAGILHIKNLLPERHVTRIPDIDIDPSFPDKPPIWQPELKPIFNKKFKSASKWLISGSKPSYDHLLEMQQVDNVEGPWVLLSGFISEDSSHDDRAVFTFIKSVFVKPSDVSTIRRKFHSMKYPGNHALPDAASDHHTFAGEIPWSRHYGLDYFVNNKSKRHLEECFEESKTIKIRKKFSELTLSEKYDVGAKQRVIIQDHTGKVLDTFKPKKFGKYVSVPKYIKLPGISVEVPIHDYSFSSENTENKTGGAEYLAPALTSYLRLVNKGASFDLYERSGKNASLYRRFGNDSAYFRSHLLFIRKDLLEKYLTYTKQKQVRFIWGEREFKTSSAGSYRNETKEAHIGYKFVHKRIVTR